MYGKYGKYWGAAVSWPIEKTETHFPIDQYAIYALLKFLLFLKNIKEDMLS